MLQLCIFIYYYNSPGEPNHPTTILLIAFCQNINIRKIFKIIEKPTSADTDQTLCALAIIQKIFDRYMDSGILLFIIL